MAQTKNEKADQKVLQEILRAIQTVRYGAVEIIIHDSKVVQIERREKVRFDNDSGTLDKKKLSDNI